MVLKLINWVILPSPIVMMFIDKVGEQDFFHSNAHWIMIIWAVSILAKVVYFTRK